jgi:hypothetical protein
LQINIKEDIVKEEDTLANESFNKMATILREVHTILLYEKKTFV